MLVGSEEASFYVHRDVLYEASGYFKVDPRTGEIREGALPITVAVGELPLDGTPKLASKSISLMCLRLPDDDPDIVHKLVSFIYRPGPRLFPQPGQADFKVVLALAKVYLLAARFEIPALEYKANREIVEHLDLVNDYLLDDMGEDRFAANLGIQMETIRLVYKSTTSTQDPLRKTLVTHIAMHWDSYRGNGGMAAATDGSESELSKFMEEIPDFMKDLLRYLRHSTVRVYVPTSAKKRKRPEPTITLD